MRCTGAFWILYFVCVLLRVEWGGMGWGGVDGRYCRWWVVSVSAVQYTYKYTMDVRSCTDRLYIRYCILGRKERA